jgi:hypothetical protein
MTTLLSGRKRTKNLSAIFVLIFAFLFGLSGSNPALAAAKSSFGQGKFTVGRDIKPGIYRSKSVVKSSANCFWHITTTGSNGNEDIAIDNSRGGILTLNLQKGMDIETKRCGTFVKSSLSAPRGTPRTTVGNGVWLVGIDMEPGTYRVDKDIFGKSCYLKIYTAGSNLEDLIAIENYTRGTPSATLEVGEEFYNNGCGTLTLED